MQSFIAVASIRLMTTLLDKENVGQNFLILSITTYFGLVLINPVGNYVNRHIHEWHRNGMLKLRFRQLSGFFMLVSLVSIPTVFVATRFFGIGRGIDLAPLIVLITAYLFFNTWSVTLNASLNMLEHRGAFVSLNLLAQGAGLLFGVIFVTHFNPTALNWILGLLAGQTLAAFSAWWYFRSHVFSPSSSKVTQSALFTRDLLEFCAPIAVTTVFMWTQNQSYRLIIESKLGAEFLATLAVGLGVASSLAGVVESLVMQYFYPSYYSAINSRDSSVRILAWNKYFKNAISILTPSMVLCFVCAKFILYFLVDDRYHDTFNILMFGLTIESLRMIANIAYVVSISEKETKATIAPYLLGAASLIGILAAILNGWIPGDKATLILIALCLSGLITCLSMFLSMRRLLKVDIDIRFLVRTFIYCLPLASCLYLTRFHLSAISMGVVCAGFGVYSLFVIWALQKNIRFVHGSA